MEPVPLKLVCGLGLANNFVTECAAPESSNRNLVIMDKNYSSTDQSPVFDPDLSLPHFDEDATLLSARPVVPLNEVKSGTRSRRRGIFGLTILAAILVGAISATLLLMQSGENPESIAETEVSEPVVSSGAAGGSTSEPGSPRVSVAREPLEEQPARAVPGDRDVSTKKRPTTTVLRNAVKPARAGSADRERDEDFENDERELRRIRREARRERRDRREQRADDLLRIREIFEGSPRP